MRHLHTNVQGSWDFDGYLAYLAAIRSKLPTNVYAFAAQPAHYDLTSHTSLHDAWLEYLTIREPASGERRELRSLEIQTCYLGPFHDCRIYLTYHDVQGYALNTPMPGNAVGHRVTGHGDLLEHEFRLLESGYIEHEIEFSTGSIVTVQFLNLAHRVEPYRDA